MASFQGSSCGRIGAAALVVACIAVLGCHDTPTEPAPAPTPTPTPQPTATATATPTATVTPTPTITPTPTPVPPPVAFMGTGAGCSPDSHPGSGVIADVCACVTEPMTVRVDGDLPRLLACNGSVGIYAGSVVTVSTSRWSITERFFPGFPEPHCWVTARLVCR